MEVTLSSLTVESIYKMSRWTCVYFTSFEGDSINGSGECEYNRYLNGKGQWEYNNCYHYHFCYDSGVWTDVNSYWSAAIDEYITPSLTEKTAVRLAIGMLQRPSFERKIFRKNARNYGAGKLILLREIAMQYLTSDILITLFDMTE
jgi:hypothetical protein